MGVTYAEVGGFPKDFIDDNITGTRGSYNPVRKLRCAWGDRYALVNELWYQAYPYATTSSGNVPIATKFTVEPVPKSRTAGSGSIAAYSEAHVTAYYTTDRYVSGGNYYIEELIPEEGYAQQVSGEGLKWGSTGGVPLKANEGPVLRCPALKYVVHYFQLPAVPVAWAAYQNTVNGGTMYTKNLGLWFATDMVRFGGVQLNHAITHSGITYYKATLTFEYKYNNGCGWQGVWRPSTGQYELIYNDTGQVLPYARSAFLF